MPPFSANFDVTFNAIYIHAMRTLHFHHNLFSILTSHPLFYNYILQHHHLIFENLPVCPLLRSRNRQIRLLLLHKRPKMAQQQQPQQPLMWTIQQGQYLLSMESLVSGMVDIIRNRVTDSLPGHLRAWLAVANERKRVAVRTPGARFGVYRKAGSCF
jgi:hypothetical protein